MIACEFCARDSTVSAKMYAKIISRLFLARSLGGRVEFVHPAHSTATPQVGLCWCCFSGRAGILTRQTARHTHARNRFVNRKTRIIGGGARGRRKWNEGAGWKVCSAVLRSVDVGGGGKNRATIRIDSRGRIEAAVFDSVQPMLLYDGTSRYGVPENLTTG